MKKNCTSSVTLFSHAIYKSIKRFTFYITGAKTTVFSDHKPLKNFFEGGMYIAKLDRWSLELQEFDISLEFIQGKLNKIADVILRLKNEGLYIKHFDEQSVNRKVSLQDRIEEILDIATNPSNFKKESARGGSIYMYTISAIFGHAVNFSYRIGWSYM